MKVIIAEKPSLGRNIVSAIKDMKREDGFYIGKEYIDMYQIELKDMSNEPETENEKHDNEINNDLNDKNNNLI